MNWVVRLLCDSSASSPESLRLFEICTVPGGNLHTLLRFTNRVLPALSGTFPQRRHLPTTTSVTLTVLEFKRMLEGMWS